MMSRMLVMMRMRLLLLHQHHQIDAMFDSMTVNKQQEQQHLTAASQNHQLTIIIAHQQHQSYSNSDRRLPAIQAATAAATYSHYSIQQR